MENGKIDCQISHKLHGAPDYLGTKLHVYNVQSYPGPKWDKLHVSQWLRYQIFEGTCTCARDIIFLILPLNLVYIHKNSKPAAVSLQARVSIVIFCVSFCQGKQPVRNDTQTKWLMSLFRAKYSEMHLLCTHSRAISLLSVGTITYLYMYVTFNLTPIKCQIH